MRGADDEVDKENSLSIQQSAVDDDFIELSMRMLYLLGKQRPSKSTNEHK